MGKGSGIGDRGLGKGDRGSGIGDRGSGIGHEGNKSKVLNFVRPLCSRRVRVNAWLVLFSLSPHTSFRSPFPFPLSPIPDPLSPIPHFIF
ncbi:hypothetical protein BLD44_004625 [Mastigocladus laminosus UU774]|nr:hypothetical protein BLD44_004625 [Mastigocladus laminosus UU774]